MTNFSVTTTVVPPASLAVVSAAMETAFEAVANTKAVYQYQVFNIGGDMYSGLLVVAT